MHTATIEELAYLMKEAKEDNLPGPIFFLGAGASKTGGIPLAKEIITDILDKYSNNPRIKKLNENEKTYPKLMECLSPNERNKLLKGYIDLARINVSHIYLAQLINRGYVDYVLTVNFDNLILRALALYNEFPSAYDMAILKDLTTTTFKQKSVVFLHGQHHGLWILNTQEEMNKVNKIVPRIFDGIKNERPWVFIGYSGEDPIFEHIKGLGRFDNGLYWVTYKDNNPCNTVCKDLLEKPNTNAFLIKGFDADTFMLKLNSELKLKQPTIIDKPFSSIKILLDNIVDIDDEEHFKGVKQRLEIVKEQVDDAIQQFEKGKVKSPEKMEENTEIDLLKKEIIDIMLEKNYKESIINKLEKRAQKFKNIEIKNLLASLYFNWGTEIGEIADLKTGKEAEILYKDAFVKYEKSGLFNPEKEDAFYNWGTDLGSLAITKTGDEAENLYNQAFEKFRIATKIKPNHYNAFYNWGNNLARFAENKSGKEAEDLYMEVFEKYKKATDIKPDYYSAFYNWGTDLGKLAETKSGTEAEELFWQAFEKFKKATDIKPDHFNAYFNWGTNLGKLVGNKTGKEAEDIYMQVFDKFKRAADINHDDYDIFYNWGTHIGNLAITKTGEEAESLYRQAFEKYKRATDIKPDYYSAYYNWGNDLAYFASIKSEKEAEEIYYEAFEKYKIAVEIDPTQSDAFLNWGSYIVKLAKIKTGQISENLFQQALEKLKTANQLNGIFYNLASFYSTTNDKENALINLTKSLENNEINADFVLNDEDWINFKEDDDFKTIIKRYSDQT